MDEETGGDGLRERLTRQGEDALGRLAQDLLENPLVNGAIARAFEAREKACRGSGGRLRGAEHPVGGRHRAPHPARAVGLATPGGHRGRRRPPRRAPRRASGLARRDHQGARRAAHVGAQADDAQAGGGQAHAREAHAVTASSGAHGRDRRQRGAPQARGDVVGLDRPLDRHQARRGDARARRRREDRGALEVEGQRARRVVEALDVGRGEQAASGRPPARRSSAGSGSMRSPAPRARLVPS